MMYSFRIMMLLAALSEFESPLIIHTKDNRYTKVYLVSLAEKGRFELPHRFRDLRP